MFTGYLHPDYARSLSEFGTPVELPRSGGWLLKRTVPGRSECDAICSYPYLTCMDWSALAADLESLDDDLVSVAAMPDPFGRYTPADLKKAFPDFTIHFKNHYVADLTRPPEEIMSPRLRRRAEKVLQRVDVEFHVQPVHLLDQWMALFELTVQRFHINGIRAYSRDALALQLAIPGSFMSLARYQGEVVNAHIQMIHDDTAYAHLAASSAKGRTICADYALYYAEIQYFADKVGRLNWGGDVGIAATTGGSLGSFKQGWSTGTQPVYFCGRIGDKRRYERLTRAKDIRSQHYFPAYREGEFN